MVHGCDPVQPHLFGELIPHFSLPLTEPGSDSECSQSWRSNQAGKWRSDPNADHIGRRAMLSHRLDASISTVPRRGGTVGGTGPRARCSPSPAFNSARVTSRCERLLVVPMRRSNFQSAVRLDEGGVGAAVFAARCNPTSSAWRSIAVPWRERPRDLAALAITPAATAEVAHATLSLPQPEPAICHIASEQSAQRAENLRRVSSAVGLNCAVRVRALKALRVAPPALRAADGLDRANREP